MSDYHREALAREEVLTTELHAELAEVREALRVKFEEVEALKRELAEAKEGWSAQSVLVVKAGEEVIAARKEAERWENWAHELERGIMDGGESLERVKLRVLGFDGQLRGGQP